MVIDLIALWTGRILVYTLIWTFIIWLWFVTIQAIASIRNDFLLTRNFATREHPALFKEYVRSGKYKEHNKLGYKLKWKNILTYLFWK